MHTLSHRETIEEILKMGACMSVSPSVMISDCEMCDVCDVVETTSILPSLGHSVQKSLTAITVHNVAAGCFLVAGPQ